jgi:hypothetical protein
LVTPRTLPCQGLIDVSGGVRVSEAASPSRRLACADTRSCQLITEPWGTPQRATPKSCCPCQKKSEKFSKIQKYIKKQLTKTIHAFQNEFQKIKTQETLGKTEQIPEKKHTKINILKKEK